MKKAEMITDIAKSLSHVRSKDFPAVEGSLVVPCNGSNFPDSISIKTGSASPKIIISSSHGEVSLR